MRKVPTDKLVSRRNFVRPARRLAIGSAAKRAAAAGQQKVAKSKAKKLAGMHCTQHYSTRSADRPYRRASIK